MNSSSVMSMCNLPPASSSSSPFPLETKAEATISSWCYHLVVQSWEPSDLPFPYHLLPSPQKDYKYPQVATSSFFVFIAHTLFIKKTVVWLPSTTQSPLCWKLMDWSKFLHYPPYPTHSFTLLSAPRPPPPPLPPSVHMTWLRTYSWIQNPSTLSQSAHGLSLSHGVDTRSTWFRVNLRAFSGATST